MARPPKYDVALVTRALQMVKAGTLTHQEIADQCSIGLSTLSRHIQAYREGKRPEVDVGELPVPRTSPSQGPSKPQLKEASLVRLLAESSESYRAKMLQTAEAQEKEAEAREQEAERLRQAATKLRTAATALEE